MATLNLHRLLAGTTALSGYIDELDVGVTKERALRSARDLIRTALRANFKPLYEHMVRDGLIEQRYLAKASSVPAFRPRFRMQGSMKYRTLNDPAQNPPQEIDVDDGVYLPTSFVTEGGKTRPMLASKRYFRAVEATLEPLCKLQGWTLDRSKPCCVRVRISNEAHIDLPLYTIPDDEFLRFAEDERATLNKAVADSDSDVELSETVYKQLRNDHIMLARRNDDWLESDPRKIEDWLDEATNDHGEFLKRVCRYVKGWRDFQLECSKISSLFLMACVVQALDAIKGTIPPDRDDLALLAVARALPDLFGREIPNPVIPDQILNGDWAAAERAEYVRLARELVDSVEGAVTRTAHKDIAIRHLREAFGGRVPDDHTLISVDTKEEEVLSYGRTRVRAPIVPRTTSG